MARQEQFSGKTAEEAIETGLAEMGISREDAEIEILEEGKKRLIGKSVPALVRITEKEKLSDGERAVAFLKGLFPVLGVEAEPLLTEEEERIVITLNVNTTKGVIGRRGEIIDAVQVLAGAVANTGRRDYKRVVVDCGNYREEREETLKHVAEKMAAKAVRLGKRVRLEPMNPYERRIIHSALAESGDVTTKSEGKEPARFVVIIPKNAKKSFDRNDREKRGDRRGRNNSHDRSKTRPYGERKQYEHRELPDEATPESSGTSLHRSESGYKKGSFSGFFGTYLGKDDEQSFEPTEPTTPTDEE